jgi:hypothetical protein
LTSTNAYAVLRTHPRWWSSTPLARRTIAARGASRYGGTDFRSFAEKASYGRFWLRRSDSAALSRSPDPTFPPNLCYRRYQPSTRVPWLGLFIPKPHRPTPSSVNHSGRVRRYCMENPVLETIGGRPGHDILDVRSDRREVVVAMASSPYPEGWRILY